MQITPQDRQMMKALRHLIGEARFSLSWREAEAFHALKKWMAEFEERMNEPKPKGQVKKNGNK